MSQVNNNTLFVKLFKVIHVTTLTSINVCKPYVQNNPMNIYINYENFLKILFSKQANFFCI